MIFFFAFGYKNEYDAESIAVACHVRLFGHDASTDCEYQHGQSV